MQIKGALHLARHIMKSGHYGIAVDCTMGNGHDTLLLAQQSRKVYAFDIQEQALVNTEQRLKVAAYDNVRLILDSHANIRRYLHEEVDLFVYNLGYLPGGCKELTTCADVVKESLQEALQLLSERGKILMVLYPGHDEGKTEWQMIQSYVKRLKQNHVNAFTMKHENGANDPAILIILERNAS